MLVSSSWSGVCKVPYSNSIKSFEEEYQVVKRGRKYHGKIITWKKRERGSNFILPLILRLLGRISSGEEGKGTEIFRKKIKI